MKLRKRLIRYFFFADRQYWWWV